MGVLMFTARVHDLIYQKSNVEYKLLKLTRKLRDLQQYASTIANGGISIGDLLNSPGSMMGRTMRYLNYAHNNAMLYAQQQAPYIQQFYMQNMPNLNAQQQQQLQKYMMVSLYTQGRNMAMQVETRNLKCEEERLVQDKERLEALSKEIDADLEAAKKGRDASIQAMAPKYTANG